MSSRSASELMLNELMNATRAQRRVALSTTTPSSTSLLAHPTLPEGLPEAGSMPDGGMDDLINSLFPFAEDMQQQLAALPAMQPVHSNGIHHLSSRMIPSASSNSLASSLATSVGLARSGEGRSIASVRTAEVSGAMSDGNSESSHRDASAPHSRAQRTSPSSANGSANDSTEGHTSTDGTATADGKSIEGSGDANQRSSPPSLASGLEHRTKGSSSPTCSSNSALSAADIMHLGDELLDGV